MPGRSTPLSVKRWLGGRAGNGERYGSDFRGGGGYLEMNVYKPLIIYNIMHSIRIMADGCRNFRLFLVEGAEPNRSRLAPSWHDRSCW